MKITIGHLFSDLLNLYGDKGNIAALKSRMEQRGIETEVNSRNAYGMLFKQYESNKKKFLENSKKVEVLSEEIDENIV